MLVRKKKLNLGCGQFPMSDAVNVDNDKSVKPDIYLDLDDPQSLTFFDDERFEEVHAHHVLEHLNNPFGIMKQVHRILKPGGRVFISVPHFSRGFTHSDHKRGFDVGFPQYFNPEFKGGYVGVPFKLVSVRLDWTIRDDLKVGVANLFSRLLARGVGSLLNLGANLSPNLCSRVWCFWVGGFEQIAFILEKEVR